jgi:hypothetical protein
MKNFNLFVLGVMLFFAQPYCAIAQNTANPIVDSNVVFEEINGLVVVEAEHFYKQTLDEVRQWHITAPGSYPSVLPDHDPVHLEGTSNNAYIELLPDTRVDHGDKLIHGENFSNVPGKLAIIHYKVHFNTPGRYYVWVKAYSTGTEDNGLHVGLNDEWPDSGQRMQWCEGKHTWRWESKQRTPQQHCGVPHLIYLDIDKSGVHEIQFSMREDGFEMDKWLMTTDMNFNPREATLPAVKVKSGKLP